MKNEPNGSPVNSKNTIVLAKDMGIGNRIQFMFSCMRVFDVKEFTLYWTSEGWVSDRFSNLFEFDWDHEVTERSETVLERNIDLDPPLDRTEGWRLYVDENDGLPEFFQTMYFNPKHGYGIDLEYNRIPERILDIYRPYYRRLHPSGAVARRLSEVRIDESCVATQVRNNDDWGKRNVPLKDYFAVMDDYPSDTKFFLSAMNEECTAEFSRRYPDRIVVLPNKNHESMVDAVADLFLMARCNRGIYAYGSTFCCLAWWLGDCKAEVEIVGLKTGPMSRFKKRLKERKIRRRQRR